MKKKVKLFIIYFVYILTFIGLVFIMLPQNIKQSAIEDVTFTKDVPEETLLNNNNGKYIILTFDDGWSSQYEAYKQLKQFNFKGTLYIISSFIDKEDRLTLDNLKDMYNNGWDICNHTVHHDNLTKVSTEEAYDEIYGCSAWILGHGFTRDMGYKHFAYPEGGYNDNIINILKKQDFLTARSTNSGSDTANLLELGRASLYGMTKKNIRDFILSDKKLIIVNIHRIVQEDSKEATEIDLKKSYFDEVVNSIIESKRQVITITEWYKLRDSIK